MKPAKPLRRLASGEADVRMFWLLGYTLCSVLLAWLLGGRIGVWGYVLGAMLGILAAHFSIHTVLWLIEAVWRGRPPVPDCRRARCGFIDYYVEDEAPGPKTYLCRCGIRHRRRGLRYVVVEEDGTEKPFLRWRPFRGWFPDF